MIMHGNGLPEVRTDKMNLSFSGCGFLGLYHMGVACCFRQYCPQISQNQISGASAGALVATALACNINLGKSASHILEVAIKARHRALGPFHPNFDINEIMLNALNDVLPDNAHELVNGKLNISVTRVSDGKNCILSKFESRAELIQAILCSCFIPFWSGYIPPKFQGAAYIDGGFSNNLLILDQNTITVSPFSGESDICPLDPTYNAFQINISNTSISISPGNIYRLTRILFPPHPEVMDKMCQQGFHDALRFLQKNNKISCTRCVAVQSAYKMEDDDENLVEPLIGGREIAYGSSSAKKGGEAVLESSLRSNSKLIESDDFDTNEMKTGVFKEKLDSFGNRLEHLLNFGLDERLNDTSQMSDQQLDEQMEKVMKLGQKIRQHEKSKESGTAKDHKFNGDNCKECADLREMVHLDQLPENVAHAIQEACDKVNKGLINYIFKFRIMKILSTLSVPYVLPFDITIVLLMRLRKLLPLLAAEIGASLRRILEFVLRLLSGFDSGRQLNESCLANFRYQVAVTEFDYSNEQEEALPEPKLLNRKISSRSCTAPEISYDGRLVDRKAGIEKSHSFKINRNRSTEELNTLRNGRKCSIDGRQRAHRKSYAGNEQSFGSREMHNARKFSTNVISCKPSERILSKMNLGFSMDLNDIEKLSSSNDLCDRQPDLVESSRTMNSSTIYGTSPESSFSEHRASSVSMPSGSHSTASSSETHSISFEERPIQIANKALNKGIEDLTLAAPKLDRLNSRLKEITSSKEALMAFHYKDADNVVKVTEIFNFSDEDETVAIDNVSKQANESKTSSINSNDTITGLLAEPDQFDPDSEQLSEEENSSRQRKANFIFRH